MPEDPVSYEDHDMLAKTMVAWGRSEQPSRGRRASRATLS